MRRMIVPCARIGFVTIPGLVDAASRRVVRQVLGPARGRKAARRRFYDHQAVNGHSVAISSLPGEGEIVELEK